ncbi:MAG: succinate dehydrogenase, cytochrome b556 subunit, partial [Gammaproteobacteria bacterium]|nr:succinate dehydrogenase, cytochrome b556 subunit [Gammaproteobacteria bacterium]
NLFTIHFPIPAIISIFHRASGVVLFLLIPFLLWALDFSLNLSGYEMLKDCLGSFYMKFFLWLLFIPFCYHLVAGLRHLLMDIHIGDELKTGRIGSWLVLLISFLLIIMAGVWLW